LLRNLLGERMSNANYSKYFDEEKGCTKYLKCPICTTEVYTPLGIHTTYHGKQIMHNRTDEIVGVHHTDLGVICINCWEKE